MEKVIGITGGIASGKSSISQYIEDMGFTVIDADIASRAVVEPGQEAYTEIISVFGDELLLPNQRINRTKLGAIIFHDDEKRLLLNGIVHPAVRKWMLAQKEAAFQKGQRTVFMDIPLLFESKLTYMVDKTILIYVDADIQVDRLMKRNQLSEADAMARINSQMPLAEKIALADATVDNNGPIETTKLQTRNILKEWGVIE